MTNIIFVRHAESDHSLHDDLTRPLTKKGMQDCVRLVPLLEKENIDMIVSSPCRRAYDTVQPFAHQAGLRIVTDDRFMERRIAYWVDDFTSYAVRQWNDFDYKLDGGESLRMVQARNIEAIQELLEQKHGKNILVGTHGTALSTIMHYYNPFFSYHDFERIRPLTPFVIKFSFLGSQFVDAEELAVSV